MDKITLAGCVIVSNKKILLLHRMSRDCYELPGGKVDEGESPSETAVREFKEELNCDIELIRKIGEKEFEEDGKVMLYTWFLAKIMEGQTPTISELNIHDHFKHLPINNLEDYSLSSNMKSLVQELKTGNISIN
jgi:8-oxo-dGTP pyrophosphatase MutT (NUDIX family)